MSVERDLVRWSLVCFLRVCSSVVGWVEESPLFPLYQLFLTTPVSYRHLARAYSTCVFTQLRD